MEAPEPSPEPNPDPDPIELQPPGLGRGYESLAKIMSAHPGLGIFRRFGCLSNEMIMYYQAEITVLERRLRVVRKQDEMSADVDRQRHGLSWLSLSLSSSAEEGSPEREYYDIIMRLREIMPQYC
jgi:hypothetical protein